MFLTLTCQPSTSISGPVWTKGYLREIPSGHFLLSLIFLLAHPQTQTGGSFPFPSPHHQHFPSPTWTFPYHAAVPSSAAGSTKSAVTQLGSSAAQTSSTLFFPQLPSVVQQPALDGSCPSVLNKGQAGVSSKPWSTHTPLSAVYPHRGSSSQPMAPQLPGAMTFMFHSEILVNAVRSLVSPSAGRS